jgi:hypothetical protein
MSFRADGWSISGRSTRAATSGVSSTHGGTVFIVGVSPDGDRLITSDDDGTIMLWQIQLRGLVATACRVAGRQLTSEEIRGLLGGDTLELPCTDQPKLAE